MPRVLWIAWLLAAFAVVADARPGGGHTSSGGSRTGGGGGGSYRSSSSGGGYSSSGSSSSSSSSGSSGGDAGALIVVGVLGGFVLLVVAANLIGRSRERSVDIAPKGKRRRVIDLKPLLERDPDFSRAVFEDFAFELYAVAHRERGRGGAAYISASALERLVSRGPSPQQVVIGTLGIQKASYYEGPPDKVALLVHVEATLIGERNVYAIEQWRFTRRGEVTSKPPTRTRTWPCPNCGAPWQASDRTCAHCGESPAGGRFDWMVESIQVISETTALASLRGTVPEQGNDLPTVVEPSAQEQLRQIGASDRHVTWDALTTRIRLIYTQLNTAWNERDLTKVRGFVTASLRNYLDYWLREYARQGLYNKLADAHVKKIELAKVTRDRYFDAITVRIFADGVDYTRTEENGRIVGGSTDKRRPYTEYWTFVRSADRKGAVHTDVSCPNCGAPIAMSDIGDCTHCNAAIENGSIDWTLSRIEQDDSYAG